jgi:membrane-bound inhibitor of C-type lysozyme
MTVSTRIARPLAIALIAAFVVAGCAEQKKKEDEEAMKNTFACQLDGERLVIRFDTGEVRLLMPGGERIYLYQIAAASGVRYSNGYMELRGKGVELQLIRDGAATRLGDCQPYLAPKESR